MTTLKSWIKSPVNFTDSKDQPQTRWNTIGVQTTFINADGTIHNTILEMFESGRTFHVFSMKKDVEENNDEMRANLTAEQYASYEAQR